MIQRAPLDQATRARLVGLLQGGHERAYGNAFEEILGDPQKVQEYRAHLQTTGNLADQHKALIHPHMAHVLGQSDMFRFGRLEDAANTGNHYGDFMQHLRASGGEAERNKKVLGEDVPGEANPRFRNRTADWTQGEIGAMRSVWASLPAAHSAGIASVNKHIQTPHEPLGGAATEGGESQTLIGSMHIFNRAVQGGFGQAFAAQQDPVTGRQTTSLRYVTAHETGHFAGKLDATGQAPADATQNFESRFAALTGARSNQAAGEVEAEAARLGLSDEAKLRLYDDLDHGRRSRVGGKMFSPTPNGFSISGHLPDGAEYGYSGTKPTEHFAELYAQMSEAPSKAYRDYIQRPEVEARAKEEALRQRNATSGLSRFGSFLGSGFTSREKLEAEARRARSRADSLAQQHSFMKQHAFGVTPEMEAAARTQITLAGHLSSNRREQLRAQLARAATPHHLQLITDRTAPPAPAPAPRPRGGSFSRPREPGNGTGAGRGRASSLSD